VVYLVTYICFLSLSYVMTSCVNMVQVEFNEINNNITIYEYKILIF
jgi:hypothetical protein